MLGAGGGEPGAQNKAREQAVNEAVSHPLSAPSTHLNAPKGHRREIVLL